LRKISLGQIAVFIALLSLATALAVAATAWVGNWIAPGDFRGVVLALLFVLLLYAFATLIYRAFLAVFPLLEGEIAPGSRQEFVYHVHLLFFLVLFYPITRSCFVPVPLMRIVLQALGARLGHNSYSSGIVFDPIFVEVGDNSLIGQSAMLIPHVVEGHRLAHYRIRIGSNCTIGAGAAVLAGVSIGDGATVSIGAVVKKGTVIGPNEVWAGIPARRLERRPEESISPP
jgi:acetyltransferase-like isoleucine patch superfamily enzyme